MQDDQSATSTPHPAAPRPRPRLRGIPAVIVGLVVTMMAALAAWTISAGAGPLFDDDFEAGDLSAWSTVSGLTVQQSEVHAGDWAARATSSGSGSSASAQRTLATPQSDITIRVFLKALSIGGTDSVNFLRLRTASGTAITELFLTPGRQLGYHDDGTAASTTGQTLVDLGTWNEVTFRVAIDGASSTVQVSLNGAVVPGLSTTTASLGTTPVGQVQLGENLTGRVYDFAYDDVTVDTGAIATGTPRTSTPPEGTGDPVLAAAGDIACDPLDPNIDRQNPRACRENVVAEVIAGDPEITAVAALGDVQYECGGLAAFQQSYDTTWGRLKEITRPAVGNHEYIASSASQAATDCDATGMAAGYFSYFGAAAGDPTKGYYSYDLGAWHVVVLNTACQKVGGCGPGSPQETWLRKDLAAHPAACTLAYWHIPYWSSGTRAHANAKTFTEDLVNARADVILTGHDHTYERFALQDAAGVADPNGVRAFVVGTGGSNHTQQEELMPNSQILDHDTFGFLRLTLHPTSYDWTFVPEPGKSFTDSGSESCR